MAMAMAIAYCHSHTHSHKSSHSSSHNNSHSHSPATAATAARVPELLSFYNSVKNSFAGGSDGKVVRHTSSEKWPVAFKSDVSSDLNKVRKALDQRKLSPIAYRLMTLYIYIYIYPDVYIYILIYI